MKVIAHCMIKNEENWIWYSLMSVLNFVDKILIFDTGSQDRTLEIVNQIKSPKIQLYMESTANPRVLAQIRQKMLELSSGFDWILILDGDEIWPKDALTEIAVFLKNPQNYLAGVHHHWNLVGDINHYVPDKYGRYAIHGLSGNLSIRLIKNSPGLKVYGEYTSEGYSYFGTPIQELSDDLLFTFQRRYFHATFLARSSITSNLFQRRYKYQLGKNIPKDTQFPQVFSLPKPDNVPQIPLQTPASFKLKSHLLSLPREIKHHLYQLSTSK